MSPCPGDPAASVFITSPQMFSGPGIQFFSSCRGRTCYSDKLILFAPKSIVTVLCSSFP